MTYTLIVLRIGHFYNLKINLPHSINQQRSRIKDTPLDNHSANYQKKVSFP